ncbi:uncharacterized protein [Drosophila bipectinata]|uniref:uncharacterized protein n=1 Tax=Drosophila bipectinata TaxID=42026 RepID=UPI001C88F9B6|nr:uncharacterized protein LOC108127652 [Drosophila bipectinata]
MKFLVVCVLAALVLCQVSSAFKIRRVIYVVPATTASPTTTTTTDATAAKSTTTTAAPVVIQQIVYCTWKNNWCRPTSYTGGNCKWGLCKFTG